MTDWCSWWPEGNWAYCCYEHDLGLATDWMLAQCIAHSAWSAVPQPIQDFALGVVGFVTWVGVTCFGWFYELFQ
jgi:hypothetical protein